MSAQAARRWAQALFFALFILAPPLDLLRADLSSGQMIVLGQPWSLGIEAFLHGTASIEDAALNLFLRLLLPVALLIAAGAWVAARWGRLYCGWLCPHHSVVELINGLMRRASGKLYLWQRRRLPERAADGRVLAVDARWWPLTWLSALLMALLWAVVLLTYLLPPGQVYSDLLHAELGLKQSGFIVVVTLVLFLDFAFARHLFCRFGCSVGLFQSLAWMANDRARVVKFDTGRALECGACNNACDNVCPMRLKPRTLKRKMFSCTACGLCISACDQVKVAAPDGGLLDWADGDAALPVISGRPGGVRPAPRGCGLENQPASAPRSG